MAPDGPAGVLDDPLVRHLFDVALLRGAFTLRSGAVSDRYFDKYRVTCSPRLLGPVAIRLAELLDDHVEPRPVRIVAPELGAVPLATALALQTGLPYAIVRGAAKGYGTSNRIEGPVASGEAGVLVEDVVTSGGAALEAVDVARAAGIELTHALCVLDRDGGGREALAARGVTLVAMLHARDLDAAFDAGLGADATVPA